MPAVSLTDFSQGNIAAFATGCLTVVGGFLAGYVVGMLAGKAFDKLVVRRESPHGMHKVIRYTCALIVAIIVALIVFRSGDGGNGNGGVDVIGGCRGVETAAGQPVRFLALSVSDAAEDVIAVIRAGARGYVTKTISGNDLKTAIRRVADGDAVFSPRLAGFVLDAFGAAAGEIAEVDEELDRLSAREREVMRLIARGYQYKEVAKTLFISVKTVETHVSAVLRKLQLSSRHELTAWAMGRRIL